MIGGLAIEEINVCNSYEVPFHYLVQYMDLNIGVLSALLLFPEVIVVNGDSHTFKDAITTKFIE